MFRDGNFLPGVKLKAVIVEGVSINISLQEDGDIEGKTFPWSDQSYDFWDMIEFKGESYNIHIDCDEEWAVAIYDSERVTGKNNESWLQVDMAKGIGISESSDPESFKVILMRKADMLKNQLGVSGSIEECEDRENLIDAVIDQIKQDIADGDTTVLAEILAQHDNNYLKNCLSDPNI